MSELIRVFFNELKALEGEAYLNNYLKYQLSPLIHGVKPAITLNINKQKPIHSHWENYSHSILDSLNLHSALLRETETTRIIIVYNPVLIEALLHETSINTFLTTIGYTASSAKESIDHLIKRYAIHHCPHELGVFLGIPLHDVEAFMDCSDKQCLLCGYWKVYSHLDYAIDQFKKYDTAKETTLKELISALKVA